jgi:MFS family permease
MVFPLFGLSLLSGGLSASPLMAMVTGLAPSRSRATAVALLMVTIQVIGLGGGPVFVGWLSDMLHPYYGEASLGMAMRWVLLAGVPSTLLAYQASRTCRQDFTKAGGWGGAPVVGAADGAEPAGFAVTRPMPEAL